MFQFFFKFFTILKNKLTNLLPNIKNKVINIVVNLTRLATADVNDIIVTLILVTENKIKHVLRNSWTFAYLPINFLIFFFHLLPQLKILINQ